jgi:hypothetical protein
MSWHYEKLNEVQCKSGKENKLERHSFWEFEFISSLRVGCRK